MIIIISIVQALLYLMIVGGMATNILPYGYTYDLLNSTGEFYFRGSRGIVKYCFFYKGFLYMCIGLIFLLHEKKNFKNKLYQVKGKRQQQC